MTCLMFVLVESLRLNYWR